MPPPVKQSHAHGVELPEVTPPTFGAEGWRAGPDLNELRLAVIKVCERSVCFERFFQKK